MKRTPLKRSTTSLKRTPLAKVSKKRQSLSEARRRCVETVLARDGGCVMRARVSDIIFYNMHACWGPVDVHEPGHRSQGADPTDPDQCVALCRSHHDWAHNHPREAKEIGI